MDYEIQYKLLTEESFFLESPEVPARVIILFEMQLGRRVVGSNICLVHEKRLCLTL